MIMKHPIALFWLLVLLVQATAASQTSEDRTPPGFIGQHPPPARLTLDPHLVTSMRRGVLFGNEEGTLVLTVQNTGGVTAKNVVARITRPGGSVGLIIDSLAFVGDIRPSDTVRVDIPVAATVVRIPQDVVIWIELSDSAGFSLRQPHVIALDVSNQSFVPGLELKEQIDPFAGRNWLFLIGINGYELWPDLKTPVNDAKDFRSVLMNKYGFENRYLVELYDGDATRAGIIKGFEHLAKNVRPEDNVVIYYGGHGRFDRKTNRGYWIPANAELQSTAEYLSNTELHSLIAAIDSRATLVISDACFSGALFRGGEESTIPRGIMEAARLKARQALVSGGDEPVTDAGLSSEHSIFAHFLLHRLEANEVRYLTANALFEEIMLPVSNSSRQTPQCRPIPNSGDEGGQFVFVRHR